MNKNNKTLLGAIVGLLGAVVLSALLALPVMYLYNYVVPYQFGCKEIDFLHAWALLLLCNLIFKNSRHNLTKENKNNIS